MDEVLNIQQAADFLKIKKSTIYQKKAQNKIPFHMVGGKIVFFKSELIEWIKNN